MPVEASQELLIKITANADLMKSQTEEAKQALVSLKQETEASSKSLVQASQGSIVLDKSLKRLGSTARLDVFRLMASDIAYTTVGMTNLGKASGLVRTGLFSVQTGLSALLGPAGLVAISIAGMAVATMFKNKAAATRLAREELEKNVNPLKDNIAHLQTLAERGDAISRSLIRDRIKELRIELGNLKSTSTGAAERLNELAGITAFEPAKEGKVRIAEIETEIIRLTELLQNIDKKANLDDFNRKLAEIFKTRGGTGIKQLFDDTSISSIKFGETIERGAFGFAILEKSGTSALGEIKKSVIVVDAGMDAFLKTMKLMAPIWDAQQEEARQLQQATMGYITQMSDAFADMMMGVEVQWDRMIQSMIASMISSGLQNLIGSLILGPSFVPFGIFAGAFQTGTPFVPKTGLYMLHQGEAVVPAEKNIYNSQTWNQQQSTVQNIYIISIDPKKLTRKEIAPAIKEMIKNRELSL